MTLEQWLASAEALLDLDAKGAIAPHGIGGHARTLLTEATKLLRSQPAGVRVKGLVWEHLGGDFWRAPALIFGFIRVDNYGAFTVNWSAPGITDSLIEGEWDSASEAKAAAEADYRRRILSALEPQQEEAVAPVAHLCGLPDFGTYDGQVILTVPEWLCEKWPDGMGIDVCLALEIQRLWGVGVRTTGHCCGHGRADGYISVEPDFVQKMLDMGYVEQNHPNGGHFQPKTKLEAQPYERAARIASMYAHHALWHGLIPYGWDETAGRFGVGLANRIADAIRHEARLVHLTPNTERAGKSEGERGDGGAGGAAYRPNALDAVCGPARTNR